MGLITICPPCSWGHDPLKGDRTYLSEVQLHSTGFQQALGVQDNSSCPALQKSNRLFCRKPGTDAVNEFGRGSSWPSSTWCVSLHYFTSALYVSNTQVLKQLPEQGQALYSFLCLRNAECLNPRFHDLYHGAETQKMNGIAGQWPLTR